MPRGIYKRKARLKQPPEPAPQTKTEPKPRGYPAALEAAKQRELAAWEAADGLRLRMTALQSQCELSEKSHLADREMIEQMQLKLRLITLFVDFVLQAKL